MAKDVRKIVFRNIVMSHSEMKVQAANNQMSPDLSLEIFTGKSSLPLFTIEVLPTLKLSDWYDFVMQLQQQKRSIRFTKERQLKTVAIHLGLLLVFIVLQNLNLRSAKVRCLSD